MNNIQSVKYSEQGALIVTSVDGDEFIVPDNKANRYRVMVSDWVALGNSIEPYTAPLPIADDVRVECQRRLIVMFNARDAEHLRTIISDAEREGIRLLRIGEVNWSPEQLARSQALEAADTAMETVLGFSKALKMMEPIPADYADDKYWT